MRLVLAAAVSALAAFAFTVSGDAQTSSAAAAAPPVQTIRIDALASDARGRFVPNLKSTDFELREDGKPVPVDEARFIAADSNAAAPEQPAPVATVADERQQARRPNARLFAVFIDEYHISPASANRARQALTDFIDRDLGPDDLFIVMKPLDSLLTIRLSHDRELARRTAASLEGRKGDYTPRNAYERDNWAGTPARVEAARTQVAVSALNALAVHLGGLADGRKTVLVVTEGLTRPLRRRGQEYLATIDSAIRSANRSRVAIYPVDPRPPSAIVAADRSADERMVLQSLAAETGGDLLEADDLGGALRRAVTDASGYYLLTYRAAHAEDGAFHPIQLKVRRAGVQVRVRSGYWATSPEDRLRAEMVARANTPPPPLKLDPARHLSGLISPWFGTSRGADGQTRVTFVWAPAARVPGDRGLRPPSRLVLTVLAADDSVLFEGPVLPAGIGTLEEPDGPPSRAVFDAPPGQIRTRMRIEDAVGQQLDLDVRSFSVRDFRNGVAIGTPEILRARNAREFHAIENDARAVPVASREFSRTERLLIRFRGYAPGGDLALAARLLNVAGQVTRTLEIADRPDGVHELDLPLAGLAAGDYQLELRATSGNTQTKEVVEFRVTS